MSASDAERRAVLDFDVDAALAPAAAYGPVQVQFAELGLKESTVYASGPVDAHVLSTGFDSMTTWSRPWTTPGGDFDTAPIPGAAQGLQSPDAYTNAQESSDFDPVPDDGIAGVWLRIAWDHQEANTTEYFQSEPGADGRAWIYAGFTLPTGHSGDIPECEG